MEQYFKTMHEYMDKGWKTTFSNCDEAGCRGALLLANIAEKKTFCPKCKTEKAAEFEINKNTGYDEFEEDEDDDQEQDYDKLATKLMGQKAQPQDTPAEKKRKQEADDHKSKKMGEYLLAGYTMLQTHCDDCQVPHFRDFSKRTFCPNCSKAVETKPPRDVSIPQQTEVQPTKPILGSAQVPAKPPVLPAVQQPAAVVPVTTSVTAPLPTKTAALPTASRAAQAPAEAVRQEIEGVRLGCIYQGVQEIYQNHKSKTIGELNIQNSIPRRLV